MEADINTWLAGAPNFGWLVVGDETIESDALSSQRAFASREHANVAFRPELTFAYVTSDLSADGVIDAQDAAILFAHWGTSDVVADINADGQIEGLF